MGPIRGPGGWPLVFAASLGSQPLWLAVPFAGPSRPCRHVARLSPSLALRLLRSRSPPVCFRSLWLPPNGSLTSLSPGLRLLPSLIPLALLNVGGPYIQGRDQEIVRAQKKASKGRPNTPPKSRSVVTYPPKCIVMSYVTIPSPKCYFNEFLFTWVLTHYKIE